MKRVDYYYLILSWISGVTLFLGVILAVSISCSARKISYSIEEPMIEKIRVMKSKIKSDSLYEPEEFINKNIPRDY